MPSLGAPSAVSGPAEGYSDGLGFDSSLACFVGVAATLRSFSLYQRFCADKSLASNYCHFDEQQNAIARPKPSGVTKNYLLALLSPACAR